MSTNQHESSTTEFLSYAKEVFLMIRQRGADLLSGDTDGDLGFRVAVAGTEDYLRHLIGGRRREPMCEKGLAIQWATAEDVCAREKRTVGAGLPRGGKFLADARVA